MLIKGFQKFTLIDYPGKAAALVFLAGCNFNCNFCHNPELLEEKNDLKVYSEEEILHLLEQDAGFIDGVVISGGEPTLNKELPEFIKKIYSLGLKIKLDTNGSNPEMLSELLKQKLVDYVAMDIKAWFDDYEKIIGKKIDLDLIKKSIDLVKKFPNYEIRITVAPGVNKDDILKLSEYLKEKEANKILVLQQFRPEKCLDKSLENYPKTSERILDEFSKIAKPYFDKVLIRKE